MVAGFAADRPLSIEELLRVLGGGKLSRPIEAATVQGVAPLTAAAPGYLSFYSGTIEQAASGLELLPPGAFLLLGEDLLGSVPSACWAIGVSHPRYSFILATRALFPRPRLTFTGISQLAAVGANAKLGVHVTISPFVVIEDEAEIGDGSVLYPGVHIGRGVRIGERATIMSGAIIGCPGQASERDDTGIHLALPHLAAVTIGAETTIGANSVIVQGSLGDTRIGRRCSIGNQVNVGHNAVVGDDCFVSAGTVIAGSAHLESGVWLAPGVTVLNKVNIGSEAVVGLGSVVAKSLPGGVFYAGNPAREIRRTERNAYNQKRTMP